MNKNERLANTLEARMAITDCPVEMEKILIGGLKTVGVLEFINFANSRSEYPKLSEAIDMYIAPNEPKIGNYQKTQRTKEKLGEFIANNHKSLSEEQLKELNKILNKI